MANSSGSSYFSSGSARIAHSRHTSTSADAQNILPHLLAPLPCEPHFHPYLGAAENARNIGVQFMHSCPAQDAAQLDSDILQQRLHVDERAGTPAVAVHPIAYPESSQRTTSHALSHYPGDASPFSNFSPCDIATLHIVDAPLHSTQAFRRGSWPSHAQMGYSSWTQSSPRMPRSPASEPPESTSDESHQDSDVEEATHMSPMMNQFQIQASRTVDLSPHHVYRAHALQPSVMTFQLSERMLQPVDDPENRHMLRSLLDMNIVADDESAAMHPPPFSSTMTTVPSSSSSLGGTSLQGPSMRLRHDCDGVIRTNQLRMQPSSSNSIPFPSSHSPANARSGDQRPSGAKAQKKSKMHQCDKCKKMFPRPSGLATHMNTHSGAKPYKCVVANCEKSFAVRSNAKRHLRTHGINPASPDMLSMPSFTVGFEEPLVTQVHDVGKQPLRYRWIPQSQSVHETGGDWPRQASSSSSSAVAAAAVASGSGTGLTFQASMSSTTSSSLSNGSDDDYDAASSVADVRQYEGDYEGSTDEFTGTYSRYGR